MSFSRLSCCCLVGSVILAGLPQSTMAMTEPSDDDYETLVTEGGELLEDDQVAAGARKLGQAYRAMPAESQVSELGKYVVKQASDAYMQAWEAQPDNASLDEGLRLLQDARALLEQFSDDLEEVGDEQPTWLVERLDQIEQLELLLQADVNTQPEPGPKPEPKPKPAKEVDKLKPDGIGIGLLAGGSTILVGATVLAILGGRFPLQVEQAKQQALEQHQLTESPPEWDEHEQKQLVLGRVMLASGITLAVVGAGLAAWGGVRLAKHRKNTLGKKTLSFAPVHLRGGAGGIVSVRF